MARILVIDDDEQIRDLLLLTLERAGHEVVAAANGEEGTRLYRSQKQDLVITDILMPEKEGIMTIFELRHDFPDVKIIAISGGGQFGPSSHYLEMAKHIGALLTIAKPFDSKELLEAVNKLTVERNPEKTGNSTCSSIAGVRQRKSAAGSKRRFVSCSNYPDRSAL
jgi:DNA-binding NtrC family response regulator